MSEDEEVKKPSPRWLEDDGRSSRVKRSRKNEARVADLLGGRRIVASGAKRWAVRHPDRKKGSKFKGPARVDETTDQGDIETPHFHVEHKQTERKSIGLKKEWLDKVADGAKRVAKDPALVITFERPNGTQQEDFVLVPIEVFDRLLRLSGLRGIEK